METIENKSVLVEPTLGEQLLIDFDEFVPVINDEHVNNNNRRASGNCDLQSDLGSAGIRSNPLSSTSSSSSSSSSSPVPLKNSSNLSSDEEIEILKVDIYIEAIFYIYLPFVFIRNEVNNIKFSAIFFCGFVVK